MFVFDRERFFADWPLRTRLPLTAARRSGVEFLLDAFERDGELTMIRELAYVLATIQWESGHSFEPVRERRANPEKNPKLFQLQEKYWPSGFFGRGYVQLTWDRNYRSASAKLADDRFTINGTPVTFTPTTLLENPDYLLDRAVSYRIAARGMREGWFTRKKLSDYITESAPPDYMNARRIINGTDRAADIAGLANSYELLLRGATSTRQEGTVAKRSIKRLRSIVRTGAEKARAVTGRLARKRPKPDALAETSPKVVAGTTRTPAKRRKRKAVRRTPVLHALLLGASLPLANALDAQGVSRLAIGPAIRTVAVGDSLRLTVQALDGGGNPVSGATIRFSALGGRMQGSVDSLGWVRAGAPGTIPVSVVAITPGGRPVAERVEVRAVPGPAARVVVSPHLSKLLAGQRMRVDVTVLSAAGDSRDDRVSWSSSNVRVLRVADGLVTAVSAGQATLSARAGNAVSELPISVISSADVSIELTPERVHARQGDVVRFSAVVKGRNGAAIGGLAPTWSFSPGNGAIDEDGAFVGHAAGKYLITASFGDHSADAVVTLTARDVRRATTVVGRLPRTKFYSSELWIHPGGKHAYLGTTMGGDRIYAIDISNPASPVITDSIVANSRSMNDIMTTADGQWMVFTREGAADRKNGIVIVSTSDPAHPKPVSEFTEGVTAGVHSAFVYTQPVHGTHVYLTNSGTGSLNIIDINDPYHPRLVSEWRTKETRAGRSLHDIDVKDGLAYVSYWSDGLVILDVGNGMKGGTPASPKLVSNFRYNAEALYTDATVRYGPGFISGTHTAWRHRNYVFIADEVFPPYAPTGTWDIANIRAYGRLQVIDVSDIEKPRSVAWYEPEYGGVHNVWVAGDTLYLGAYNGGFHAFDVSGELRGDLKAQGREIADLMPADADGVVPNRAFTWGVVVKDGLAYVNDMITGLWVVRIEGKKVVP